MVFAIGLLLGTLAGVGAPTPPKHPTLEEAAKRATLVVFGQIVRLEQGPRPIATLQLQHIAKGDAEGEVSFFADKVGCCLPRAAIGHRILAFLEPSGLDRPRFRFVFDTDGSLDGFLHGRDHYLAATDMTGVQLPSALCDPKIVHGLYGCTAKLDAVLKHAKLKSADLPIRSPAGFRVVSKACDPCELGDWLDRTAGPGAQDCGSAAAKAPAPDVVRCATLALHERRPFKATVPMQGIDSLIRFAYAASADGTRLFELHYDSSVEGQGVGGCAARVGRRPCRALSVPAAAKRRPWDSWLSCEGAGQEEVLCAQSESRSEVLGPERDVSQLQCAESDGAGHYESCAVGPASAEPGARNGPPPNGPSLVCYERRPRGTVLAPSPPFPPSAKGLWCEAR